MPWYQKADDVLLDLIDETISRYHPDLLACELDVTAIFAMPNRNDDGEIVRPAISVRGYQALATIKQLSLKDRVAGRGDVELLVDGEAWSKMTKKRRIALLDHEFFHLEVQRDADNQVKSDDIGRPLFKMRKHDIQIGWFDAIVQRHGDYSQEAIQAKDLFEGARHQLYFPFAVAAKYD